MSDILEIARECNITFQKGDVLFIRVGVTKEWETVMTDEQKKAYSDNKAPEHAGVEATTDVLRWLWDTGFSAIAGDAISWEVRHSVLANILVPSPRDRMRSFLMETRKEGTTTTLEFCIMHGMG